MSFLNAIKKEAKKGNHSSKTPQVYMREFKEVINDLINHDDPIVRNAACSHKYAPTKMLADRLMVEDDLNVLTTILMNPKTSYATSLKFCAERKEIADQLSDDIAARFNQ